MKIIYSHRATRDLERIADYYVTLADPAVARAVGARFEHVINRIARLPDSAPRLAQRPNVRVALVIRYPYKVFYRPRGDIVEILHIRHTSRRPWEGE